MELNTHTRQFTIKYSNKMQKLLKIIGGHFDINYFCHFAMSVDGFRSCIRSNPEFAEYYDESKCYINDPFVRHPKTYSEGAVLWSSAENAVEHRVYDSYKDRFDMHNGLTIVQKSRNPQYSFECFSFAAPASNRRILSIYLNEMAVLRQFIEFFRTEAAHVLLDLHNNPISMMELKGMDFYGTALPASSLTESERIEIESSFNLSKSIETLANPESSLLSLLSLRERQCLNLYLRGKSAQGTSQILNLSRRTVEHYLESIKNKMNCERKSDLLEFFNRTHFKH